MALVLVVIPWKAVNKSTSRLASIQRIQPIRTDGITVFMHEFMQLIHLRENGHDKVRYRETKSRYIPSFGTDQCQNCGLKLVSDACEFCDSDFFAELKDKISGK